MDAEKEAGQEGTPGKSPDTNKTEGFQARFNALLAEWKKTGCPRDKDGHPCGAPPHRVKMLPGTEPGIVVLHVDCNAGHEDVWQYEVPEAEVKDEAARQASNSPDGYNRDAFSAWVKIKMDVRTQQFEVDSWVPTPGLGIQLAGVLQAHFYEKLRLSQKAPAPGKIITPGTKLVDPKGRALN